MADPPELIAEAKGYNPVADIAKREVDSYYATFGAQGRDTDSNWGLTIEMIPDLKVREEMWKLRMEAQGARIEPDPVGQVPAGAGGTSRDAVNPDPGPPISAPSTGARIREELATREQGIDARERLQGDVIGTTVAGRNQSLASTAGVVDQDIAARQGTGSLPEAPGGTMNASAEQEGLGRPYDILDPGKVSLGMSQSTTQQVVEPREATELREAGFASDLQAADEQDFAARFAAHQRLRLENERSKKLLQMQKEDQIYADKQKRIAEESEGRIRLAEQALKDAEVDPNFNPMKQIWEGDDWGKKATMLFGAFLGGAGASGPNGTGVNMFFDQYEKSVNRKIDLMQKRYNARKDYLGAAQDGYARMRQILQDEAATRAMIEARAWQMFDAEIDKIGQQYGIDTSNAQYLQLRSGIFNKYRDKVMESAKHNQHTVGMQEQQKDLKVVPLGGGEDKTGPNIKAIVQAREVKKLPIIEGALDNVATALSSMAKDHSYRDSIAQWLKTGNGLASGVAPYIAENKDAFTRIAAAANDYVQSKAGSAQTEGEVQRLAPVIGRGGAGAVEATKRFYDILQNERRAKEADIQTMEGYDVFMGRKGLYSGNPKTQTYEPRVDPIGSPAVK